MTLTRSVNFFGTLVIAGLLGASGSALARDNQAGGAGRHRATHAPRTTQPHTRTTERQRTENGHTRSDTWTNTDGGTATRDALVTRDRDAGTHTRNVDYTGPNGQTATRDLTVAKDKEAGTVTRDSNYTTVDGREGSKSDVIQRTEDGFTRDTVRTLPSGETHTRAVDVTCNKNAGKLRQAGHSRSAALKSNNTKGLQRGPWRKPPQTQRRGAIHRAASFQELRSTPNGVPAEPRTSLIRAGAAFARTFS